MRRNVVVSIALVSLVAMAAHWAWACGNVCGERYAPCGRMTSCQPSPCVPVRCAPACYVPVVCQPACCQPAAGPTQPAGKTLAPAESKPTLAPPNPVKKLAPPPVSRALPPTNLSTGKTTAKSGALPSAPQLEAKPAVKASEQISLPAELPAAGESPTAKPATPRPEIKPAERSVGAPSDKPLVAQSDNPFILETDQLQIWTDSTGDHRIEARFVSFDESTVRLQRANGRYIRVAYDRLSSADRERVRDLSQVLAMKTSMK